MSKQMYKKDYSNLKSRHFDDWNEEEGITKSKSTKISIQKARRNALQHKTFIYCNEKNA